MTVNCEKPKIWIIWFGFFSFSQFTVIHLLQIFRENNVFTIKKLRTEIKTEFIWRKIISVRQIFYFSSVRTVFNFFNYWQKSRENNVFTKQSIWRIFIFSACSKREFLVFPLCLSCVLCWWVQTTKEIKRFRNKYWKITAIFIYECCYYQVPSQFQRLSLIYTQLLLGIASKSV